MKQNPLANFLEKMQAIWRPLDSNLIAESQKELDALANDPHSVRWLKELQTSLHKGLELYRDPKHGFILLAHTEEKGLYRPPHDHGRGWVIYSVHSGEMEMGAYGLIQNSQGEHQILRREIYRVKQGESRVYLPGDIHDTKCISDSVVMLRLTSCDLEIEKKQGRMHRYGSEI